MLEGIYQNGRVLDEVRVQNTFHFQESKLLGELYTTRNTAKVKLFLSSSGKPTGSSIPDDNLLPWSGDNSTENIFLPIPCLKWP